MAIEVDKAPAPIWIDRNVLAALGFFVVMVLALRALAGWSATYPLDDTYIHLAMARTMALAGVWGTDASFPAAATSSPLWTLLVAGVYALWPQSALESLLWAPLAINTAIGTAVVLLWWRALGGGARALAAVGFLIFVVPLPAIAMLGMEHVLQILLTTVLSWTVCVSLARDRTTPSEAATIALLAAAAVAARYESVFLLLVLTPFALWRGRFILVVAMAVGGAASLIGFGAGWVAEGGGLLPNPLQLKRSDFFSQHDLATRLLMPLLTAKGNLETAILREQIVLMLCLIPALLAMTWERRARPEATFAIAAWLTTVVHLCFGGVGWLHRYEAWIIALDLLAILLLLPTVRPNEIRWPLKAALTAMVLLGLVRGTIASIDVVQSVDDRRLEHLAPADFVRSAFPRDAVMVNDLGAMAYFAPGRVIDLYGLGHNEPLRLRRQREGYSRAALAGWAQRERVSIAILQVCWKEVFPRIPADWHFVATWTVPRNVVFGDRTIGFFAVDPAREPQLREALTRYTPPTGIVTKFGPAPEFDDFMRADDRLAARMKFSCPPLP